MGGGVQDHAAEHAGPEGVGLGEVEGEVEEAELAGGLGVGDEAGPAVGEVADDDGRGRRGRR